MPTYDYECEACGHKFEEFHAMLAKPLTECPQCHKSKLVKLIGPGAAVIIRGTKNPCSGVRGKTKKTPPKKLDKLGEGKNKGDKPFWRDGPIDKSILENPEQYIRKGTVE